MSLRKKFVAKWLYKIYQIRSVVKPSSTYRGRRSLANKLAIKNHIKNHWTLDLELRQWYFPDLRKYRLKVIRLDASTKPQQPFSGDTIGIVRKYPLKEIEAKKKAEEAEELFNTYDPFLLGSNFPVNRNFAGTLYIHDFLEEKIRQLFK